MTPTSTNGRPQGASRRVPARLSADDLSARHFVSEARRQRILWAMAELMRERGMRSLTVSGIIGRARVSRQTFYLAFDNLDGCIDAMLDEAVALIRARVEPPYRSRARWIDGTRDALFELLELFDERPELAELCVTTVVVAPSAVRARRRQVLDKLAAILDAAQEEPRAARPSSPITADGVIGGALAIVHNRLVRGGRTSFVELLNPLMAVIVLPYLGAAAARNEMSRPAPSRFAESPRRSASRNPMDGVDVRLTYRTMRAMTAIATQPGLSNVDVSRCAGIADQGQISKLLARLASVGLVENTGAGQSSGLSNAWQLTPRGRLVAGTFTRELAMGGEPPTDGDRARRPDRGTAGSHLSRATAG